MVDGYGFDREFHDRFMGFLDLVARYYWRVEVDGAEHIPHKGGALIVMNHAGTVAIDVLMVKHSILRNSDNHRIAYTLMADFLPYTPFVGDVYWKTGNVLACWDNGFRLLHENQLVIVCPEGTNGVGKHFTQRYQLYPFGKGGFARLAVQAGVPIIPLAVVGAEEIYPVVYKNKRLGQLLGFPFFPVTFTFPWFGPLGLIPLPSKWMMRFCPPLYPETYEKKGLSPSQVTESIADDAVSSITSTLADLLQQRKHTFFSPRSLTS